MSEQLAHSVMICGATEDICLSLCQGGVMLYSKALEPLIIIGYCKEKWLLISNSAGLLAWFCLSPNKMLPDTNNGALPISHMSLSVIDISSQDRCFIIQHLQHMYSSDQIRRILSSVSDSLRTLTLDCYCPESDCASCPAQCMSLPKDELEFYAKISGQWINESLANLASFVTGQHGIQCLPLLNSATAQESEKSENIDFLYKWLADNVRNTTGLRYSDAMTSVKAIISALKRPVINGGVVSEENVDLLFSILLDAEQEACKIMQTSAVRSPDKENLESFLYRLMEWVADAQRSATWRSSAEDSELLNILCQMKKILEDADPTLCVNILEKTSPQALESITALYQLEKAQEIRSSIREFVLVWIHLLYSSKSQDPSNTLLLRMLASQAGGGVLLNELLREIISSDSLSTTAIESIMSLGGVLIENRSHFLPHAELPCDIPAFFDAALRIAVTHNTLLSLCLKLMETMVNCSVSGSSVDSGKKYGALMSSSLSTCQNADGVELVIDGIIQHYLSLTADKYKGLSNNNFNELITAIIFWARAIADPQLLEQGLVHTTDLRVLIDFCTRQLEIFEIDSSCPKDLQDAFSVAHKMFITVTSMEFF